MLDGFEEEHPDVKYNIIQFFMKMIHPMKSGEEVKVGSCVKCGEPSSNDVCKKCQIISMIK
jgi:uncharacterized protein (TIGR00269 family)